MMPSLFDRAPRFDGPGLEPSDETRLRGQLEKVRALMGDGKWRPIAQIAQAVGGSEAGTSARLRDLRKQKFGGHAVERRRVQGGVYVYRLVV